MKLAYIVQLNLPGSPIKIGSTVSPWSRFDAFNHGTPVECRFIGLTIDGVEREQEMLAATDDRKIKGEWRYATSELARLVAGYHHQAEWFVPSVYDAEDIRRRVCALHPDFEEFASRGLRPRSIGYHWAKRCIAMCPEKDPLLPVHWAGFRPAAERPSFIWEERQAERELGFGPSHGAEPCS